MTIKESQMKSLINYYMISVYKLSNKDYNTNLFNFCLKKGSVV